MQMPDNTYVGGPYFDDLHRGQVIESAPSVALTEGMAATHQAIVGDRLRLSLDENLSARVTGAARTLAHPALVIDMAIGQSTLATHHVKANLFYRGLRLLRHPHIGDTLSTRTTVVGLRKNSAKPGRAPTGLVALHIDTRDQHGRPVLDFHRCAMLPMSPNADPSAIDHADDLGAIGRTDNLPVTPEWDLDAFRTSVPGEHFSTALVGHVFNSSGDVVTSAPELARLTMNIAATHHDSRSAGSRLVYGGHTIGLALAQATRALPNVVTVLAWDSCDHTGPVHEGDTLSSELSVLSAVPSATGGGLIRLQSIVHSHDGASESRPVLDWIFWALLA